MSALPDTLPLRDMNYIAVALLVSEKGGRP